MEHAVDPVPDPEAVGRGLQVEVAGPGPERLQEHDVDQLDHRRLGGQRLGVVQGLVLPGEQLDLPLHGRGIVAARGHDRRVDLGGGRLHQPHPAAERPAELVDDRRVHGTARGHDHRAVLFGHGQQHVLLHEARWERAGQRRARGRPEISTGE